LNIDNKLLIIHENNCTNCRTCQLRCSFLHFQEFNPSKAYILIDSTGLFPKISFHKDCKKCGICIDYCLYDVFELVEVDNQ